MTLSSLFYIYFAEGKATNVAEKMKEAVLNLQK